MSSNVNTIYMITNNINGKKYIGQTWISIKKRWLGHCEENTSCILLSRAIKKNGKENFSMEEICSSSTQELADYLEITYIKEYDTTNSSLGYNLRLGGSRGKHSEESKKRMSLAQMGNKNNLGHKDTDEVKLIKSEAAKKRCQEKPNTIPSTLGKSQLSIEKQKIACDMFINNTRQLDIARYFNVSADVIRAILKRNKIK